jgi:hypothetical protein
VRGEGRGEDRRQRRYRSVHQAGKPGLHPCQDELAACEQVLLRSRRVAQVLRRELSGSRFMACLGACQIAEQLAGIGIGRARCRGRIELLGLALHVGNLLPDAIETQVLDQPDRASDIEVSNVLPSQWNDELSKPALVDIDQPASVLILLRGHAVKDCCATREVGAQLDGIGRIDPTVLLLC